MIEIMDKFYCLDREGDMEIYSDIESIDSEEVVCVRKDNALHICGLLVETGIPINVLAREEVDIGVICGMFMCYPIEHMGITVQ